MGDSTRLGLIGDPPHMAQAVRNGDVIAIAGQVAINENNELVGKGDFVAQAEQCFDNVERWLEAAGGSWGDLIQVTTYLTSAEYAAQFLAVRQRRSKGLPAATTTVLAGLLHPDFLIEVTALAVVSRPS
ncbi:MAG: yabJ 1 [Acidimicrobiia bacterium]|nr:yabJ 1 [Acidimicrobiia bacterium]